MGLWSNYSFRDVWRKTPVYGQQGRRGAMTKLEQNTTNDIGGLAIFISRALKKIPPIIGMLAVLSLGQTNFSPLIGGDLGIFASPAEARVIRHRPVHHPVHRPVHHLVHRPVHAL